MEGFLKRLVEGCFLVVWLLCVFCWGVVQHTEYTPSDKPADGVVGRWRDNASCVAISANHIVTTRHQGGGVGSSVEISGEIYEVAEIYNLSTGDDPADVRVVRIVRQSGSLANLSDFVEMYSGSKEAWWKNQPGVMGGFGKGRGQRLYTDGEDYGYTWAGSSNTVQRWGRNEIDATGTVNDGTYVTEVISGDFDDVGFGGYVNGESILAEWDSGGGWFMDDGGEWRLAGLFRGVEHKGESWYRSQNNPQEHDPDYFDSVRVSSYYSDIAGQIQSPSKPTDVNAVGYGGGDILLTWSGVSGADNYSIYYDREVSNGEFDPEVSGEPESGEKVGDVRSVVVSGLKPGVGYYFAVVGHSGLGVSDYSEFAAAITTDINGDGYINFLDIREMKSEWLMRGEGLAGDVNGDGWVDCRDYAELACSW